MVFGTEESCCFFFLFNFYLVNSNIYKTNKYTNKLVSFLSFAIACTVPRHFRLIMSDGCKSKGLWLGDKLLAHLSLLRSMLLFYIETARIATPISLVSTLCLQRKFSKGSAFFFFLLCCCSFQRIMKTCSLKLYVIVKNR